MPFLSLIPLRAWLYLAAVVAITAGLWGGYRHVVGIGRDDCERDHAASLAASIERATAQANQIAVQDAAVSEYYEKWRTRVVVQTESVTHEIPPDCRQCGLGPNGLQLLNSIRRGESAPDAGQPDGGMPAAPVTPNGFTPGAGRELRPGQPHVQRLRQEASIALGSRQGEGI